jgi:hypothetical protein
MTKTTTIKNKTSKTTAAKLAAQLANETIVQPVTVTETTPSGETMTKKTPPVKPTVPTAQQLLNPPKQRKSFATRLKEQNQRRDFIPVPVPVLESHIAPEYLDLYHTMRETNAKRFKNEEKLIPFCVQVEPSAEFMYHWANANGLNRGRKWPHVGSLGNAMRNDFDPSCTHWCLTHAMACSNGGHSGVSFPAAMYQVIDLQGNWLDVFDAKGNKVGNWGDVFKSANGKTISPWNLFESLVIDTEKPKEKKSKEEIKEEIENAGYRLPAILDADTARSYEHYYRTIGQWRINIILDSPDDSFLKMEDLRLNMSILDVLNAIPAVSDIIGELPIQTNMLLPVVRQGWLRSSPKGDKPYGDCSIGGRLAPKTAPARFGLFIDDIEASIDQLTAALGGKLELPKTIKTSIANQLLKEFILAMTLAGEDTRKKICNVISGPKLVDLALYFVRPEGSTGWKAPKTDWTLAAIYSLANGGEIPTDDKIKAKPESYRGDYWDRGLDHPTLGSIVDAYKDIAKQISDALDDNDDLYDEVVASIQNRINNAKAKAKAQGK